MLAILQITYKMHNAFGLQSYRDVADVCYHRQRQHELLFFPDSPEKKKGGGEGVCVYNNEEIAPINNWCNKSVGNVAH